MLTASPCTRNPVLFKNIVGKGENAGDQHFLLFPQCFHSIQKMIPKNLGFLKISFGSTINMDIFEILLFRRLKSKLRFI